MTVQTRFGPRALGFPLRKLLRVVDEWCQAVDARCPNLALPEAAEDEDLAVDRGHCEMPCSGPLQYLSDLDGTVSVGVRLDNRHNCGTGYFLDLVDDWKIGFVAYKREDILGVSSKTIVPPPGFCVEER